VPFLAVVLAACGSPPPPSAPAASAAEGGSGPAEARAPKVGDRMGGARAVKPIAGLVGDPSALADRWLVVVSRSATPGGESPALDLLAAHPELEVQPQRLPSSAFRSLAPCEELVVAGAYVGRDEAAFQQRKLAAIDVTSELLFTGAYVGRRPQLEAWCAAQEDNGTADCGDTRFVEEIAGKRWLALGLDATTTKGLIEGAPAPTPAADGSWVTPLSAASAGSVSVGDVWEAWAGSTSAGACKVVGLSAVTRSIPSGEPCGGPEVLAEVDCRDAALFAVRPGARTPTAWEHTGEPRPAPLAAAMVAVTQSDAFRAARGAVQRASDARRAKVDEKFDVDVIRSATGAGMLVTATVSTGATGEGCTAEGEVHTVVGIVGPGGEVVTAFQDIGKGGVEAIVDLDGDGRPEIMDRAWPGVRSWRAVDGSTRCSLHPPQCINPC
jgi:hypothetical protein